MIKKRGQVTIFIIIAIMVVGLGVVVYLFYPRIQTTLGIGIENPTSFIQTCLEDEIKDNVQKVSLQGGSINPELYTWYNNQKVEYLCYTGEYYRTCMVQQAMLIPHIEEEIKKEIEDEARDCFDSLKKNYERRGYDVELKEGEMNVELLPKRVVATFNNSFTITKTNPERYDSFVVVLNNNLYELSSIANSILEWEVYYGNADVTLYMLYYRDLKVEKKSKSDGSKIYIISDRNTGNKFQFASRSVVFPPGYGT